MRTFLVGILAVVALLVVAPAPAHAQKSNLMVGDGGTQVRLLKTARVTLVAGVATITDPAITLASNFQHARQVIGGTPGVTYPITARTAGSVTITAKAADGTTTVATDTSIIGYWVWQYK